MMPAAWMTASMMPAAMMQQSMMQQHTPMMQQHTPMMQQQTPMMQQQTPTMQQPAQPQDGRLQMSEPGRKAVVSLLDDMRKLVEDCKSVREAHLTNIQQKEKDEDLKKPEQKVLGEVATAEASHVSTSQSEAAPDSMQLVAVEAPQPRRLVRQYLIDGFANDRLNGRYEIEPQEEGMVNGHPTYWANSQGELYFMYWNTVEDAWTISPKLDMGPDGVTDLFLQAQQGGCSGLAFSTKSGEVVWKEYDPTLGDWVLRELHVGCDFGNGEFTYQGEQPPPKDQTVRGAQGMAAPGTPAAPFSAAPGTPAHFGGGGFAMPATPAPAFSRAAPGTPAAAFNQVQEFAAPGTPVGLAPQQLHPVDYTEYFTQPQDKADLKTLMKPELARKSQREPVTNVRRVVKFDEPTVMDSRFGTSRSSSAPKAVNDWGKGKGKGIDDEEELPVIPDAEEQKKLDEEAEAARLEEEKAAKEREEKEKEKEKEAETKKEDAEFENLFEESSEKPKKRKAKEKASPKPKAKRRSKKKESEPEEGEEQEKEEKEEEEPTSKRRRKPKKEPVEKPTPKQKRKPKKAEAEEAEDAED